MASQSQFSIEEIDAEIARREGVAAAQSPSITLQDVEAEIAFREGRPLPTEQPKQTPKDRYRTAAREAVKRALSPESGDPLGNFSKALVGGGLGAGAGAFGAGKYLVRKRIEKLAPELSKKDAADLADEVFAEAFQQQPATFGLGAVTGALGSGGAVVKGANAGLKAVGAGRIAGTLTPKIGQPASNLVRQAAGGAAATVPTAALEEGRAPTVQEAAFGAGAGLAGAQIARGAAAIGRRLERAFKPNDAIVRKLQEITSISEDSLEKRAAKFRADTKKEPAIGELLTPRESAEINEITTLSPETRDIFAKGLDEAEKRFQDTLASAVRATGKAASAAEIERARDLATDRAIEPIRRKIVSLTATDLADLKAAGALGKVVPPEIRKAVLNGTPTVGEIDALRRNLAKAAKAADRGPNPALSQRFRDGKDVAERIAAAQYQEYGDAIRRFAEESAIARGAEAGAGVTAAKSAGEFRASIPREGPESKVGARLGARAELTKEAQESVRNAERLARSLATDQGRARLTVALGGKSAGRISDAAESAGKGLTAIRSTAGKAAQTKQAESDEAAREVINAVVLSTRGGGGAMQAGFFARALGRFKMSDSMRNSIAKMMVDPNAAPAAISALRKAGVSRQEIVEMYQAAAIGAGASQVGDE